MPRRARQAWQAAASRQSDNDREKKKQEGGGRAVEGENARERELVRGMQEKGWQGVLAVLCRMLPGSEYLLLRCRLRGVSAGRGGGWTVTTPENGRRRWKRGGKAAERGWPALEWPCAQPRWSLPTLEAKARAKAVVTDAAARQRVGGMKSVQLRGLAERDASTRFRAEAAPCLAKQNAKHNWVAVSPTSQRESSERVGG